MIVIQTTAHSTEYDRLIELVPELFGNQFDIAQWLFLPLCGKDHWILIAVYLEKREIQLYNSLTDDEAYTSCHWHTISWLKYFLSWRFGEYRFVFPFTVNQYVTCFLCCQVLGFLVRFTDL